ncbi:Protein of unknown function [Cribrihabitans marinus]|uniref:DUF1638 domain-containing protein n=1 Tax=Cribrihabitans marinus TaxID=1227549 RepID=A0A1H7DTT8_9RHOB|nr:DUF1638 domain-containing protein [Cribrihabitans marinus]GGH40315.1 hypothetical protein GCM10010973_36670 [Cribrihabitans marinus]SEK05163.1 Protein of unknown function [Cribrihabitans marinus]
MTRPADLPDDTQLTRDGVSLAQGGRILLVACGALAREIVALRDRNGWDHIDLTCLPAILHNHPERIADAVEATVTARRDAYQKVYVVYADCGTGGRLQDTCARLGVEMIKGPHCYSFYEGNAAFAAHDDEVTAFYLTDFLARQFDAFVWKPLGLDRHPELREMYFGNYTKLVYQAQSDDSALTARARACAERLGLAFERRFTGYGDLERTLADWAGSGPSSG